MIPMRGAGRDYQRAEEEQLGRLRREAADDPRRALALEIERLDGAGLPLRQIARQTGAPLRTVKRVLGVAS